MADFYGALLTTSFRVKDPEAFSLDPVVQHFYDKARQSGFGVAMPKTTEDYTALGWDGQYPGSVDTEYDDGVACKTCREQFVTEDGVAAYQRLRHHLSQHREDVAALTDDEVDDCYDYAEVDVEYNLTDAIEKHIHDDDVCVLQVSGAEKLRYIGGEVAFITNKGTVWFPFGSNAWDDKMNKKRVYDLLTKFGEQTTELGL